MKHSKLIFSSILIFFMCVALHAQDFKMHSVKRGETLESISKQYAVTPASIIANNKEIKLGDTLKPNTILVISLDKNTVATKSKGADDSASVNKAIGALQEQASLQIEPTGFISHKVKKKETLFGISKKYDVTENNIKKYNKELYSTQLKKGMRLQIPKYAKADKAKNDFNPDSFETYAVLPKETRWSIAHKYGITIDSLIALNPTLPKNSTYLAEGQQLLLPKIVGSSIQKQEVQLYTSYTVPAKQNFYRLEQEFGVKSDEIVRLNPEITERGGLKEGMVIRIPKKKIDLEAVNTDNYIFYIVKPKQNEFRLTRKFGMTWEQLTALNPDLAQGLKAGMVLKLPKGSVANFEVKNALILDKINLLDSVNTGNKPKLVFMLPFRLDKIDLNSTAAAKKVVESRADTKVSLGLYTGALVALDSISKLGITVDVKTFDNQRNISKTKEILSSENFRNVSAIIGPLDAASLKEVAVQASAYDVPVIAPITADMDISLRNVYFTLPTDDKLRERVFSYMDGIKENLNLIVISDDEHLSAKEAILAQYPNAKSIAITKKAKTISMNKDAFARLLVRGKDNCVFLETANANMVSSIISILNSNNTEKTPIRLFTTNKSDAFDNDIISLSHLSNLKFTYPSINREVGNDSFVKAYQKQFGTPPDKYATRGFDVTFDILLKLAYKNNLFAASKIIGQTEYSGNKFNYTKDYSSGYFNTASYLIMYDDMRIKEVKF